MVPIKTINADTKSSMLLAIKNEDFPKIYLIFSLERGLKEL